MPQKPNKLLRIVVPIILALVGIGIGAAVLINSSRQGTTPGATGQGTPPTPPPSPADTASTPPTDAEPVASKPAESPAAEAPSAPAPIEKPTAGAAPAAKLAARTYPVPASYEPLGSLDPASGYEIEIKFSRFGAGIDSLALTNEYTTIYQTAHEVLQRYHVNIAAPATGVAPFAAVGLEIDGTTVQLGQAGDSDQTYWQQASPGVFEALIVDDQDQPEVRVTRRFELEKGSRDVIVRQSVENLGSAARNIRWFQFGPVDLPPGSDRLGMDKRRVRFGYLNSPRIDPSRQIVDASRFMIERQTAMGSATVDPGSGLRRWASRTLWPNADSADRELTLAWVGMTSRHFCVVIHPLVDPAATNPDKSFRLGAKVDTFVLPGMLKDATDATLALTLESQVISLPAGGSVSLDTGIYAGPESKKYVSPRVEPRAAAVGIGKIVVYTLGGPCGFCTFPVITNFLYGWLTILHDYVLFDYALSIIMLVFFMRLLLHPVTRHAQISMQRFSKQMQALAPKQKKIQEKYAGDQQKMREELARLMREEHISYSSAAKGCLTPFLQTPIWIALYALLFFMYELRHEAAFFGVFQWLSQSIFGVKWAFLADLSEPDHFIPFGGSFGIPLLSDMFLGKIDGLNLLPLLLGVVFYIQQKYLTPPSTTTLTPEQEQQQKIMKVIMVVMFPLFMYNMPSALTLYFVVNSTLGIIESRAIRRHAEKHDLYKPPPPRAPRGGGAGKQPPGRPGFFARLQQAVEARQKEMEQRQKELSRRRNRK